MNGSVGGGWVDRFVDGLVGGWTRGHQIKGKTS